MKTIAAILIILFFTSCISLVDKIDTNNFVNTDDLKYNGYYFYVSGIPKYEADSTSFEKKIKTEYKNITPIIFYKNGLVFFKRRGVTENEKLIDDLPYRSLPHDLLNKKLIEIDENSCKTKRDLVGWGNYHVKGDSLKISYYDYKFQHPGWTSNKLILKRINGNIINDSIVEIRIYSNHTEKFYFTESDNIPDSEAFEIKMK
jgi:hypothetical protein